MKTQDKIIIVGNIENATKSASIFKLMGDVLSQYSLTYADNAAVAFQFLSKDSYDLMVVSICKSHEYDYNKIEQIKTESNQTLPILYLSCDDTDINNKGLDYCNLESIFEPHGINLFNSVVRNKIDDYHTKQDSQNEISEVTDALLRLQNDNAKLYDISRFLQRSFFCKDIQALCEQLFIVTRSFNTSCTLYVHSEKNNFFISDGITHGEKINNDILTMLKNEARIFQFGNDRAVFNWTCASLLVNKLGDDVDNLALLMDGFEMGFRAIESVGDFNQILDKYRKQNYQLKIQVARVVDDVATNITDELSLLGATAMLTIEQEDSLVAIAEQGRKEVDALFNEGLQLDTELSHIMTKMRTQDETKVSTDANNDSDSIDFF